MNSVKLLYDNTIFSWKSLLKSVGADSGCLPRVNLRDRIVVFQVDDLSCPAASILKQCMLTGGADALVHREVITCKVAKSSAIVYGTPAAILRGCNSLLGQPFGLPVVSDIIKKTLTKQFNYSSITVNNKKLVYSSSPLIMGILNVTPDSFSDGGKYSSLSIAVNEALMMEKCGASIIDIGGESTRPGSKAVSAEEQIKRVIPVIDAIRNKSDIPISVDTTIPEVADRALEAGAGMINSIDALETDGMLELAVSSSVPVVIMHKKGKPETMQQSPSYNNTVEEVGSYLSERASILFQAGVSYEKIIIDPGIGFGKRLVDNILLIQGLKQLKMQTGCRVLLGYSRKSFLGQITGLTNAAERDSVTHIITVLAQSADIVRVHDVQGAVNALKVADKLRRLL